MEGKSIPVQNHVPEFLSGGGEMGKLIREFDWSKTSLGPVTQWPKSLRTCVQIMLTSRQPYWIGWGKDLIKLYNDPYQAIAGGKHPWALGKPASVVWRDIWKDIGPMLKTVMEENEGIYVESQLLIMERNGYPEETHYTFSYTPVAGDDGGTEGMICANSDDTERILSERQLRTLTELGKAFTEVKSNEDVYQRTIEAVSNNNYDFPFAVLYQLVGTQATVVNSTPLENSKHRVPSSVELPSEGVFAEVFQKALRSGKPQLINAIQDLLGDMPKGAWPIATDKAIVLPIVQRGQKDAFGFFVMGVNPYRLLDEKFTSFFQLVTDQVATSLAGVHAAEEERKRLEALAEIDRAKTTFFSNISHEFRTPLTLLLGPIQDVLNEPDQVDDNRKRMEVALRNVQRMQKLVNLLLDFSKIEAGRLEADFVPVDIVSVTEDLVSNFRSAIEKAGMELIITKEIIEEPVYLDVDMWEKIILNLVSNAFKYSEKGFIEVSIRKEETSVLVAVKDSGIGIPESEIDRVFERFHRVQNVGGRSQEGTGIGLAMVRELVKLQDGSISVQSKVGEGSVFTVSLPLVKKNVKKDKLRIHKPGAQSSVYIEEAVQWLPASSDELIINKSDKRFTILLADDNSDMRKYINRLLAPDYNVIVVTDGEEAFSKAIEAKPDLILSDIMMPKLDGFGLLKKLRNNLSTRSIPVIFLSARAGEEARVEGIKAGADDYLTKPFSSRELLARVGNHIAIASTRTQTEKEFFNLFLQSPAHIHVMKGPEHTFEFFHPLGIAAIGRDITGMKAREALPYMEGQGFFEILDSVYKDGTPAHIKEARALIPDENGEMVEHYFNMTYLPWKDLQANIQGVLQFTFEVTELVQERLKAEANERNLRSIAEQAPVAMTVLKGVDHTVQIVNDLVLQLWGRTYEEVINIPVGKALPEIVAQGIIELLNNVYKTGKPYRANEYPVELDRHGKRETVYLNFMYQPLLTAKKRN
ncbi:MAG TPA: response regulator [Ohtaekwangia sp.]